MPMDLSSLAPGATDPELLLAETPSVSARTDRRDLVRIFLVLLAFTFVLRLPAFFTPVFNSDETFLATQAHVLNDGGQLYQDAIDRKPPIVPYIYAATFSFFETTALWSVRVVAMLAVALTALLLAIEARRRYGDARGMDRGDPVRGGDDHVHAAGRSGRELRGVHAAVDDGSDPLRAPRARLPRGGGDRRGHTRQADRRGHVVARRLPHRSQAREARHRRGVRRLHHPDRAGRARHGPVAAPLLDGSGQRLVRRHEDDDHGRADPVPLHDRHVDPVQPAAPLEDPECVEGPQARRARRSARHRPVALDAVGRGVGGGRPALLRPLLHAADPAAGPAGRRRVVARQPRVGPARGRVRAGGRRSCSRPPGYFFHPRRAGAELRVGVALPRHHHQPRRPDLRVGQRARDLLGVGPSSGDALPHVVVPHRQLPRSAARPTPTPATTPKPRGTTSSPDFTAHPPKYFVDTSPAKVRGSQYYPISDFPRLEHIVDTQYKYVVTIDGIDVYKRK